MAKRAASVYLALGLASASSLLASCHEETGQGYPAAMAPRTKVVATTTTISRRDEEALFSSTVARFLAGMLSYRPDMATSLGDHRFDGRWPDLSEDGDAKLLAFFHGVADELSSIDASRLSAENRIDHALLTQEIAFMMFAHDELKSLETSPVEWTGLIGDALDPLLSREFAPLPQRLASIAQRLEGIPAVVAAAKTRLREPPKVHTETAIEQNRGLIALVTTGLDEHLQKAPEMRAPVEAAARTARGALEDFQRFLEQDLLPRSRGDFRLGRERFEKKLRFVLDDPDVSPDELAQSARALMAETREKMAETALEVWPLVMKGAPPKAGTAAKKNELVKTVLAKLAEDRPTNATIVAEAAKLVTEATSFVRDNDLVKLPDEACRVIEMPEYRRGVSVAYCDSTGPLEAHQESVYAISPTPKDWPGARVTSFYREYNRSMLRELTVHEAMPGHFLQAMHANRFKSGVRAVFSNGPFVEGWAMYTEWLMSKRGFGGPKVRLTREKMALRMAANAVLDYEIHAGKMEEKDALALMTQEAFQEEGEAVGKWRRARLTSGQLSTYYYGFREFMRLRLAAEKRSDFNERQFNDSLLAHGSPPMRHLRTLLSPGQ
jgi:uncharacterized protein (DUF885 family)